MSFRSAMKQAVIVTGALLLTASLGCRGYNGLVNAGTAVNSSSALPQLQASAVPATITAGQSSTLTWQATDADSISIDGIQGKLPTAGSRAVQPTQTTTYTLKATGQGGDASATVTVMVTPGENPAPTPTPTPTPSPTPKPQASMLALTASPTTISPGGNSTLSWATSNVASLTINNGVGAVQPIASGSVSVSPSQTTTYTATATGTDGSSVLQSVTISVAQPPPPPTGTVNVTTWHMNNLRSGLNDHESILTPAKVSSGKFGKLFSYSVDGYLYAQPLYVSNLSIKGTKHNVVFAATEYDSVYAFDADTYGDGTPLWKTSLLQPGETPQQAANPRPWIGITSTPVIDISSQTMYVVSAQQGNGAPYFRLHALDITTGSERPGSPVPVTGTVDGTNQDSVNGKLTLPKACLQRTALLLSNGVLYFGFSGCHSGWIFSYRASDLSQIAVRNVSPNANGYGTYAGAGGIWMGGGGPVSRDDGYVYISTGNGPWDGNTAWSNSVLKLDSQLNVVDSFTPSDWQMLQCKDLDVSGGGALLIPGTSQILAGGKGGKMYLLNADKLGGLQANDGGAAQVSWFDDDHYQDSCTNSKTGEVYTSEISGYQIFSTAAFFNGSLYLGVTAGPVQQFSYASGQLQRGPVTPDQIVDGSYGTTPFVSSNGNGNGIVWALDHGAPIQDPFNSTPSRAVLRAYDANNVSTKLYDSSAGAADVPGYGIKFTSPIVANGKVFIGTAHDTLSSSQPQGELDVYGLKQ